MSLKVRDIRDIMESYAPSYLKESYDNVGLMVGDLDSEITKILIALDCTLDVIKEAVDKNCNLIVSHHPLLFLKPSTITNDTLQGKKIIELIRNNINLYSSHTNLDVATDGMNDIITKLLGFNEWTVLEPCSLASEGKEQGIGRLVELEDAITLISLCKKVKEKLKIDSLRYSGDGEKLINKIAIVNGSGEDYFKQAFKAGAECIITGDTSYHYVSDYSEMGIGIIDAGHFETEWPSMIVVSEKLKRVLNEEGYSNEVVVSDKCKPVYKFF
ncbi:Nif3-like dinuclear metal center hexameric protein [Clostridium swellfunianum]|uniref:Nif3-like dinuclear metal center hexameric protein n=1 Tax=Clostridium swellfunianum TaxID=1367462 RepID=UPI00202F744B|nr:Nif3-like dinuclear metal center hexameric protein [Clostridium swellfunianum]MCM0648809.1 Nif3-like dinuclear metal center hexameric protein [Clostridium swellfunianum]